QPVALGDERHANRVPSRWDRDDSHPGERRAKIPSIALRSRQNLPIDRLCPMSASCAAIGGARNDRGGEEGMRSMLLRGILSKLLSLSIAAGFFTSALAADFYPDRPIRVIVPSGAGGA